MSLSTQIYDTQSQLPVDLCIKEGSQTLQQPFCTKERFDYPDNNAMSFGMVNDHTCLGGNPALVPYCPACQGWTAPRSPEYARSMLDMLDDEEDLFPSMPIYYRGSQQHGYATPAFQGTSTPMRRGYSQQDTAGPNRCNTHPRQQRPQSTLLSPSQSAQPSRTTTPANPNPQTDDHHSSSPNEVRIQVFFGAQTASDIFVVPDTTVREWRQQLVRQHAEDYALVLHYTDSNRRDERTLTLDENVRRGLTLGRAGKVLAEGTMKSVVVTPLW